MNKTLAIVLAIVLACAGLFYLHKREVNIAVQAAYTQVADESNKRLVALMNKADAESLVLQAKIKETEDAKNAQIDAINKRHDSIIAGLQNRPNRPTSNSSNNSSTNVEQVTSGSTGAELYREDGEFLAREAARAEIIRVTLLQCYAQYDEVKDAIERFKQSNPSGFIDPDQP